MKYCHGVIVSWPDRDLFSALRSDGALVHSLRQEKRAPGIRHFGRFSSPAGKRAC